MIWRDSGFMLVISLHIDTSCALLPPSGSAALHLRYDTALHHLPRRKEVARAMGLVVCARVVGRCKGGWRPANDIADGAGRHLQAHGHFTAVPVLLCARAASLPPLPGLRGEHCPHSIPASIWLSYALCCPVLMLYFNQAHSLCVCMLMPSNYSTSATLHSSHTMASHSRNSMLLAVCCYVSG